MRNISLWAKEHAITTRLLIVLVIYPLFNLTGWFLGDLLAIQGFHLYSFWGYPLSLIVILIMLTYPSSADRSVYRRSYTRRKIMDGLLAGTTFLFIVMTGNNFTSFSDATAMPASYASSFPQAVEKPGPVSKSNFQKKAVRKWFHALRKKYRDASNSNKVLLTILAIVVGIFLFMGLIALTCSIACAGSEALAYVVFFLGMAGIILGLVKIIKSIHRGPKKPTVSQPAPSGI